MAKQLRQATERKREVDHARALLLDPRQSAAYIGVSLRKFYDLRATGQIPPPVQLGERTVRHRRADLEAYVAGIPAQNGVQEPRQLAAGRRRKSGGEVRT